jgi:DNA-binding transcriptional MerR regulator
MQTDTHPKPARTLVKMSVLARMSGVPAATIKHYLREGLLPAAERKTSRNMAFYDPALVDRIRRIKALQREHFLPLRLIKSALDGEPALDGERAPDAEAAAAIERALHAMAKKDERTREELVASGMPPKDLAFFESLGLVTAEKRGDREIFGGDDLALLRVLGASRKAGITREMLPPEILGAYVGAIQELVRVELEMFRRSVVPRAKGDVTRLTDVATRLSEELVVLIRRKMLLPTLASLLAESATAAKPRARTRRRRPRR